MQFRNHQSMSTCGAALLAAFVVVAAGCGSSASDADPTTDAATPPTAAGEATPTAPAATAPAATETVEDTSTASNEGAKVDACTLLSDDEAGQFLGGQIDSTGPTSGVGESVCQWATEQGWSVDVSVGSPGTAPGNTFVPDNLFGVEPTPIPELDGSGWDIGLGTVDFAAGERRNSVLVVSPSEENAQTAVAVAVLIRDRIEAAS